MLCFHEPDVSQVFKFQTFLYSLNEFQLQPFVYGLFNNRSQRALQLRGQWSDVLQRRQTPLMLHTGGMFNYVLYRKHTTSHQMRLFWEDHMFGSAVD